jgi:membrane associated rhomboid family serine protease
MVARTKDWQDKLSFGGRIPWAVGLLLSITVVLSLFAAFADRHAGPLFDIASLRPADVWRGQLWRLATWPLIEPRPIGLIFNCLFLYWFGPALAAEWGSRRFLLVFAGVTLAAGAGTCLVALIDPEVLRHAYLGGWVLTTALVVSWGLWFPDNIVRLYFVLPIRGYWLAWLTVGITVVYAVYSGWTDLLPELLGEASILAWLFRRTILARWSKAKRRFDAQRRDSVRLRSVRRKGRGVVDYLRAVEPPRDRDRD